MAYSKAEISGLYKRRAKNYDLTSNLYYLLGLRMQRLRQRAIDRLQLQSGDTVFELGCGTGLNFGRLRRAVGAGGNVVGVDISSEMLAMARQRVHARGWKNVTLIQADLDMFAYPVAPDGVISTFALTLAPQYDEIVRRSAGALQNGGGFVLLDLKRSEKKPEWFVRALAYLSRPFGVTLDLADRHPWESLERYFEESAFETHWFDCVYIANARYPRPEFARLPAQNSQEPRAHTASRHAIL